MTLNKSPFEVMVTGEKKVEIRLVSPWMTSRLVDKETGKDKAYDVVEFTNGYGHDVPRFTVPFNGYKLKKKGVKLGPYSNGLKVDTSGKPTYVISLGDNVVHIHS